MKALTPQPNASQVCGTAEVSLLISIELPNIPSPTTLLPFRHARFNTLPSSIIVAAAAPTAEGCSAELIRSSSGRCVRSKVRALLGHSPTGLAESSSLTLRTAHSPQVAPHPSSRKRSYHCRLQGGNDTLDGTLTQQFDRLHRRTSYARQSVDFRRLATAATYRFRLEAALAAFSKCRRCHNGFD
jgi:hypothetical protein